jgi:hypothetical protein
LNFYFLIGNAGLAKSDLTVGGRRSFGFVAGSAKDSKQSMTRQAANALRGHDRCNSKNPLPIRFAFALTMANKTNGLKACTSKQSLEPNINGA